MPRRRPPGAGPGILFTILFVLPLITAAAQQQQSPDNAKPHRRAPPGEAYADVASKKARKNQPGHLEDAPKHNEYTPLNFQNERAVATEVSSAPALPAVRAPVSRNAAPSGGLTAASARSLQDWEIEDFVLLATVDGQLHARDRYNGNEIWKMDIERPMLDTTYNLNKSQGEASLDNQAFIWIVEPKEDGALYILTPGPRPVLKSLEMTVKQLAEELSPYHSDDPPVVYTAEKRNMMLVVDARTGNVTKSFSPGGSMILDTAKCESPKAMEYFDSRERECSGVLNIGRTEYLISITNAITLEHICTIKYSEWIPNIRDRDLQSQYREPMDKHYIYSRYDGNAISLDHKRSRPRQRPLFQEKFASPVARVFDVARPNDNDDPEAALVLLSQPPGPQFVEEKSRQVWLNTTESGSWYALSEINYPAVTDAAPPALCYSSEWSNNELLNFDGLHYLPDRRGLVGVHILDQVVTPPSRVPQLDAPTSSEESNVPTSDVPDQQVREPDWDHRPKVIESSLSAFWVPCFILLVVLCTSIGYLYRYDQSKFQSLLSRILKSKPTEPAKVAIPAPPQAEPQVVEEITPTPTATESAPVEEPAHTDPTVKVDEALVEAEQEKKVRFDVPAEEEDILEPLSRSTTAEQPSPTLEDSDVDGTSRPRADSVETNADGTPGQAATPTKKKKTHRGKRGGVKKLKKAKDEDEVDQIVQAAKELENPPTLHPDEVTVNGDDVQDVSNKKKIGKLTIDFDLLLGNGSGGTFVFEGEWNVSITHLTISNFA
jgi:serine/threonine-protein kinase/endoribonuclease IRE1